MNEFWYYLSDISECRLLLAHKLLAIVYYQLLQETKL